MNQRLDLLVQAAKNLDKERMHRELQNLVQEYTPPAVAASARAAKVIPLKLPVAGSA